MYACMQAQVDKWLAQASTIEHQSRSWVDPFASSGNFSDEVGPAQTTCACRSTCQEAHILEQEHVLEL